MVAAHAGAYYRCKECETVKHDSRSSYNQQHDNDAHAKKVVREQREVAEREKCVTQK